MVIAVTETRSRFSVALLAHQLWRDFASLSRRSQNRVVEAERLGGTVAGMAQLVDEQIGRLFDNGSGMVALPQAGHNADTGIRSHLHMSDGKQLTRLEAGFLRALKGRIDLIDLDVLDRWLRGLPADLSSIGSGARHVIRTVAADWHIKLPDEF